MYLGCGVVLRGGGDVWMKVAVAEGTDAGRRELPMPRGLLHLPLQTCCCSRNRRRTSAASMRSGRSLARECDAV